MTARSVNEYAESRALDRRPVSRLAVAATTTAAPMITTSGPPRAAAGPDGARRRGRERPVLGMLTQDLLELVAEQWLGAVDGAREQGCDLICFCGRALEAPGFQKQANAIYDLVSAETVDGLIVWTSLLAINVGADRLAEFCGRFGPVPVVSVEQPLGQAPVVLMDNRRGMSAVVTHLIEEHGHRRIAFVRGPANHAGAGERYQGYRDALASHGLPEHPELVSAPASAWVPEEAAAAVIRMLAEPEPPEAVVAANDDFAVAVLSALSAAGVRTPEDIAVVGFDDFANIYTNDFSFDSGTGDEAGAARRTVNVSAGALSLTTVHAPFREMGRCAVETLLALLRGEEVPPTVTVPTELVVRRSCGCRPTAAHTAPADPAAGGRYEPLRQALTQRSAALPADWPDRLSAAFVGAARGDSPEPFLRLLEDLVQASLRGGESIENWCRVLYALRELVADASARAEEVWLQAQLLLNESAERYWRFGSVLAQKRNQIVREVGHELITAPDLGAIGPVLAGQLPRLGIPGCYLAVYESGPARSRLLLGYEGGARVEVPADSVVFESVRLVPGGRLRREAPFSVVAAPVYFRDQQLGFVLFELGPRIGWMYAALQEQLGSALHRVLLVERERAASAAVAEAHRREERHRLAGELHDSVSQALFSMNLHTRAVELAVQQQGADPQGRVARGLAELRDLTQGALSEMRALIFQLRPEALHEEGLVAAVRRHAAAVAAREGFAIGVRAGGDRLALDEHAERELFRIVQEALHNSVKHARPGRVDIRLEEVPAVAGTLLVEVTDDGAGFDADAPYPGHLGLAGMRERAGRLGGRFTVHSSPAGTTVRVILPGVLRARLAATPGQGQGDT
jgi:signal transduction histidine kinase/DNA-binding LacI/PurR family transcriptional regulator